MITADTLVAAQGRAAVGPVLARGFLRATGQDAQDYLNRMSTQDLKRLSPGQSAQATFLNAKGHLLGEGTVLALADALLLALDPAALEAAQAHLEKFVIMDDVAIEDVSPALRAVPVLGPDAAALAERAAGPGVHRVPTDRHGVAGVELWATAAEAEAVRAALRAAGAAELSPEDLEALRILGGVPRWGAELDDGRLPMEAGLTRSAISFTKGCYIGQEVVLRATARGHLQRGLVQLALPAGAGAGAALAAGGQEVGAVTSAVDTPEGRIGLGYLRRAHWKAGARLEVAGGEAVVRRVIVQDGLPGAPGI